MPIKIGINGFGRIGGLVFRAAAAHPDKYQVVGINDPFMIRPTWPICVNTTPSTGALRGDRGRGDTLVLNGRKINVYAKMNPNEIPWGACGADYVVESTGVFTSGKAALHLQGGAKKVVISAPPRIRRRPPSSWASIITNTRNP